ncbi:MAG: TRAP transporter fused permease subunit [Proteobacteria bacterium]|nr:TRAP transporter fused permease subunit [Pseudomonadota bacterium]MBU4576518.1 TRAP transporter fused permease subunit [Pseudomonadota bacterium]
MADSAPRQNKFIEIAFVVIGLAMVAYHMVSTQYLFLGNFEHQNLHLMFALVLTFLGALLTSRSLVGKVWLWLLIVASLVGTIYVFVNMEHLEEVTGFPDPLDMVIGVVIMVAVTEATRQAWGWTLPIVAILFIGYFALGSLIPGPLYHRPFSAEFIISYLCIGFTGVYGTFLSISANAIFMFVVFGGLLGVIKVTDVLYELGKLFGRVLEGGPGQTAVVSSSLVGMVTGAAVANVAITGAFTIPYMKRVGYPPAVAGAIEATASTGGQLMPPVMGAAAFLMAFFVGVPYVEIMLAAVLPAVLFYVAVLVGVQFISVRQGIKTPKEKPDYQLIKRRLPVFLIPLVIIIVLLLLRFSPMLAAFWAIVVAVVLSMISKETRPSFSEFCRGMAKGALTGAWIAVSLCVVGMMAQTLISTGLGTKIAALVETLSGGNVYLALIMTMLVSLLLGCGVPPVAAYSLVAIVTVPVLVNMGVLPISAHFFCFYFSIISAVTPPVALGALAGAGIAGASYFKTAVHAFKLAIAGFIIPYLLVFNPILTLHVESWILGLGSLVAIPLGLTLLGAAIYNVGLVKMSPAERLMTVGAASSLLGYSMLRDLDHAVTLATLFLVGLVLSTLVIISQIKKKRLAGGVQRALAG